MEIETKFFFEIIKTLIDELKILIEEMKYDIFGAVVNQRILWLDELQNLGSKIEYLLCKQIDDDVLMQLIPLMYELQTKGSSGGNIKAIHSGLRPSNILVGYQLIALYEFSFWIHYYHFLGWIFTVTIVTTQNSNHDMRTN